MAGYPLSCLLPQRISLPEYPSSTVSVPSGSERQTLVSAERRRYATVARDSESPAQEAL